MNEIPVNLVVALPAEAKPLNRHFGLKRQQPDGSFPVYQQGQIRLVLCGPGKAAAAQGTRFLHEHNHRERNAVWINVGIAGHSDLALGTAIVADGVKDEELDQEWQIPCVGESPCRRQLLRTSKEPRLDYKAKGAFDMEAAGFLSVAREFTRAELAQCFKVISDNRDNPARQVNGRLVTRLIEGQLKTLSLFIRLLEHAAHERPNRTTRLDAAI